MQYFQLFWSFFQIGLFSIGGGLAALPLIKNQIVDKHAWLTIQEFGDLVSISEMTPGPIAINASTFVGSQLFGYKGAIVATLGCILPSCIIVSILAYFYFKFQNLKYVKGILNGLRPAIVAFIAAAGIPLFLVAISKNGSFSTNLDNLNLKAIGLFAFCLFVLKKYKLNPILIIFSTGLLGAVVYFIQ